MSCTYIRSLVAAGLTALAGSAIAGPDAEQAEKFVRDFDNLVGQAALRIETMPLRREHQAKVDELETRAKRLFGGPLAGPLGACVQAASYLASAWTTQMVLAAGSGRPHMVAGLASDSMIAGERRQQCRDAVEDLRPAKSAKTKP